MPFKNVRQMKAMFVHSPKVARAWVKKYGLPGGRKPTKARKAKGKH